MENRKIRWGPSSGGWQEQRCRGVRIQEAFWEEGRTRAERSRIEELKLIGIRAYRVTGKIVDWEDVE